MEPDPASHQSSARRIHPAFLSTEKLLEACLVRRTRHTGPGGQHRNKVETAVEIVHRPTGIVAFGAERRSQEANRQVAVFRLRVLLAIRFRTVESAEVHPSSLWLSRCRNQRIACNENHLDFPSMLAEALDAIHAKDYDVARAAGALGCSSSQLVRFLGKAPDALEMVNSEREKRSLRRLLM